MSRELTLVFPHQLFEHHPALHRERIVNLVEDSLFFGDPVYPVRFHKHKLVLHIAAMEHYADLLRNRGYRVEVTRYRPDQTIVDTMLELRRVGAHSPVIHLCRVTDDILERRIVRAAERTGFSLHWYETPLFLSPRGWLEDQLAGERPPRMQQFYIKQRRRLGILLEPSSASERSSDADRSTDPERPVGGRWSFDTENRKPWPARTQPPPEPFCPPTVQVDRATHRVDREFPDHPGSTATFWYPVTHHDARRWLDRFLEERLARFGLYEDAICTTGTVLYHSVLSPLLNIGLLTPEEILLELDRRRLLSADVPVEALPAVEGFLRQVVGWREYIRGVYLHHGVRQRTANHWSHRRKMPTAFYSGETGLLPADTVIRRVTDRSYAHHIERLMILGNLMLLCEIDPDQVYRWFMEFFIDAYDWVMVPNVYGMSQYADGGLLATKPYISGANYIRKMSDYPRGRWEDTWTALFWRFLHRHRSYFANQPRMGMLMRRFERDPDRMGRHRSTAEAFLAEIE